MAACRGCNSKQVESILSAFGYRLMGCLTCGLVWLEKRLPYKTTPPRSR